MRRPRAAIIDSLTTLEGRGAALTKFSHISARVAAIALLAGGACASLTVAAQTGNAEAGREKIAMCLGCHEIPGWRTAFPEVYRVPMIAGQHPQYIVKALQEYRSGERSHPSMRAIAGSLTDEDMANLAAYYGAAPTTMAKK